MKDESSFAREKFYWGLASALVCEEKSVEAASNQDATTRLGGQLPVELRDDLRSVKDLSAGGLSNKGVYKVVFAGIHGGAYLVSRQDLGKAQNIRDFYEWLGSAGGLSGLNDRIPELFYVLNDLECGCSVLIYNYVEGKMPSKEEVVSSPVVRKSIAGFVSGLIEGWEIYGVQSGVVGAVGRTSYSPMHKVLENVEAKYFEYQKLLRSEMRAEIELEDNLDRFSKVLRSLPRVFSHGDFQRRNLIIADKEGEVRVIDYDCCDLYPVGFDIGRLLQGNDPVNNGMLFAEEIVRGLEGISLRMEDVYFGILSGAYLLNRDLIEKRCRRAQYMSQCKALSNVQVGLSREICNRLGPPVSA